MGMFQDDKNEYDDANLLLMILKWGFLALLTIATLGLPIILKIVFKNKENKG